jgi:nucleoside-diphosphate-sugar epimerase
LISGPEHPTWADFFGAFERMLGVQRTVSLSEAEALAYWRRSRRRGWLAAEVLRAIKTDRALRKRLLATREGAGARWLAERVLPGALSAAEAWAASRPASPSAGTAAPKAAVEAELPMAPLRPWLVHYMAKRARVRIDKAEQLLGYRPRFGLEAGMRLAEQWARWAGLLE